MSHTDTSQSFVTDTSARSYSDETAVGSSKLIPPILDDFKMIARTAELRVAYDAPTNQTTYTYTLSWVDDKCRRESYRIKSASMVSACESRSQSLQETKVSYPPHARAHDIDVHPVMAICDGPCRKAVPSNKLSTMGRCGHYLCEACYGIVFNSDGTKGCSSFSCNWRGRSKDEALDAYEKEICRKQRQRANDMQKRGVHVKVASAYNVSSVPPPSENSMEHYGYDNLSETDYPTESTTPDSISLIERLSNSRAMKAKPNVFPGQTEMIIVKLVLIERNKYNAILRVHTRMEVATSMKLKKTLAMMLLDEKRSPRDYLSIGVPYSVEVQSNGVKKLRKIYNRDFEHLHLYEFPLINDYLYFVLDTIGYVNGCGNVQISLDYD